MVPKDIVERSVREIRQDSYEVFRGLQERHRPPEDIRRFVAGVEMEIYRLEQGSPLAGHSLAETNLRGKFGVMVLAIQGRRAGAAQPRCQHRLFGWRRGDAAGDPGATFKGGGPV